MSVLRIVLLLVAVGAAVGAALLVQSMQTQPVQIAPIQAIVQQDSSKDEKEEKVRLRVLVAAEDLRLGQYLIPEHFVWQAWPYQANTTAFYVDQDNPNAVDSLIGAVVRDDIMAGEPFTPNKVAHPGTAGFMAAVLTPGMRAVSVEISSSTAAGGFIYPNDRVDVVMMHGVEVLSGGGQSTELAIDTILNNVRVLAIDGYYQPALQGQGAAVVGNRATLELSKEDALVLTVAQKKGDLSLVLRSIGETDEPSGSTPRSRQLASRRGSSVEGIRVFAGGNAGLTGAPPGSGVSGQPVSRGGAEDTRYGVPPDEFRQGN